MSHRHKAHNRLFSSFALPTIIIFGILCTIGSGGGGDGDSGPSYMTYEGNTNPVVITLTNAPIVVGNILYGGISTSNVPIPAAATTSPVDMQYGSVSAVSRHLLSLLHVSLDDTIGNSISGFSLPIAVPYDDIFYCETDGYFTVSGDIDPYTYTGTLNYQYVNCIENGVTYNGSGTFRIDSFIPYMDVTMSFPSMTMSSTEFNGTISGTMRLQASLSLNTETDIVTMNYVARDNNTGKMYKFDNVVMTMIIDDIYLGDSSSGSITFTGSPARVYDSVHGYVDVATITPLSYSSINLTYPDSDGVMLFYGQIPSSIKLTVLSANHVLFELDIDPVGGFEIIRYLLWEELAVNANTDLTDTDGDGMHDSWESMFPGYTDPTVADADSNPDGDALTNLQEYQQGYDPSNPLSP